MYSTFRVRRAIQMQRLRTHHLGERRHPNDLSELVAGVVSMYSVLHKGLNRHVQRMTMESSAKFGARTPSPIPDLFEPELQTFGSDRGMTVCDIEEIAGVRYCQDGGCSGLRNDCHVEQVPHIHPYL